MLLVSTQKRRSPGLRVGTASCPDQVRLANGTRFTCTVQIEGTQAPYAVTLRDVDAAKATGRSAKTFPARFPVLQLDRIYVRDLDIETAPGIDEDRARAHQSGTSATLSGSSSSKNRRVACRSNCGSVASMLVV